MGQRKRGDDGLAAANALVAASEVKRLEAQIRELKQRNAAKRDIPHGMSAMKARVENDRLNWMNQRTCLRDRRSSSFRSTR